MNQARCTLTIQGLDCAVEVNALTAAFNGTQGVVALGFDLIHGTMTVDYDHNVLDPASLVARVTERTGMRASLVGIAMSDEIAVAPWRSIPRSWVATVASGLALLIAVLVSVFAARGLGRAWPLYGYGLSLAGGFELFPKAVRGLRSLRLDIHVLMGLAVLGALVLGQWDEAATVAFLFGLSERLEGLSLSRARKAVRALLEVTPQDAEVVDADGSTRRILADRVRKGDRVRPVGELRGWPDDRIAVDGQLAERGSAQLTGESVPILREPGDAVFAGTVNGEGALEVEAAGPLGDALISRVSLQVRQAPDGKAPVERRLARFAAWYTPLVVAMALAVMVVVPLFHRASEPRTGRSWLAWFSRGLVVLVIACPCALVIATPVAVVSALASAARHGVLVKGGQFLEEAGRIRVLAFDKTGTLTRGEPDVVEVVSAGGFSGERGRSADGRCAGRSRRPRARPRHRAARPRPANRRAPGAELHGLPRAGCPGGGGHRALITSAVIAILTKLVSALPEFPREPGTGPREEVGTSVALSAPSGPIGWIRLADQARPEAARVLAELAELGIQTVMLTGDNSKTAEAMAAELRHDSNTAGPARLADKVSALPKLDGRGLKRGMVMAMASTTPLPWPPREVSSSGSAAFPAGRRSRSAGTS